MKLEVTFNQQVVPVQSLDLGGRNKLLCSARASDVCVRDPRCNIFQITYSKSGISVVSPPPFPRNVYGFGIETLRKSPFSSVLGIRNV